MEDENKYFDRIDAIVERLETQKSFILDSLSSPSMLFDKASEVIKSTHEPIFQIFNIYEENKRMMNVHEFQSFLCSIVNEYFVQQFNSHNVEVKVRNPNSFPSIYAVYYNGSEIIQFDIFNKFYGVRDIKTKEMINKEYDERKSNYDEELNYLTRKLEEIEEARIHTFNYIVNFHKTKNKSWRNKIYFGVKEIFQLIFQSYEIYTGMDKLIEKYKDDILYCKEEYKKYDYYTDDMINSEMRNKAIKVVEPLFIRHEYRLETERHSLY